MSNQASFALRGRNPDVLTCIANLSNDEVFTPPGLANQMLDTVAEQWAKNNQGRSIWAEENVKFLDPCSKSGVFLREITSRLTVGLESVIPDLDDRVDHILRNQVFGLGTTFLTSLLTRRSLYCSKLANGEHSVAKSFDTNTGNIWFERLEHFWEGPKCKYCGAPRNIFDRAEGLETHAYAFIHSDGKEPFLDQMFGGKMNFDVIIGNPPYQLSTEGYGTQARPIYHKFIEQAKKLDPRLLSMVIPARWFSGGMGLDKFRAEMLADKRIRIIEDFPDSNDVFPGTQIKCGVCYFLWDRDNAGPVSVTTHDKGTKSKPMERELLEKGADVFIRYNEAIPIIRKVFGVENEKSPDSVPISLPTEKQFKNLVSSIGAFGLDSKFQGKKSGNLKDIKVYRNGGIGFIAREKLIKETHMINKWKVFIPRAGSGSDSFPHPILGKPFVGEPGSVSSWTYMYIGPFKNRRETQNAISYINTQLFRFLVLLHKPSQDATRGVYTFVPVQDFSKPWTDKELQAKYRISKKEIEFINMMIRPVAIENE